MVSCPRNHPTLVVGGITWAGDCGHLPGNGTGCRLTRTGILVMLSILPGSPRKDWTYGHRQACMRLLDAEITYFRKTMSPSRDGQRGSRWCQAKVVC